MGTWNVGPFDNDAAADLLTDLDAAVDAERPKLVRAALDAVLTSPGYLDYDDAAMAVAAAALVAHARGVDPRALETLLDAPLELPDTFVPLAVAALDRVVAADSEWRELWSDGDGAGAALAELAALRAALLRPV